MYTATDIATVFEGLAPKEIGLPGDQLGFVFGDAETPVTGLACLWNIHVQSIRAVAEAQANMIICHEGIWLPEQNSGWYDGPAEQDIFANCARRQLLEQHRMVVYRSHSNWDALERDGVADQAVLALGIQGLQQVARQRFFSVQQLPEQMSVAALGQCVQDGLHFPSCRVFGDVDKRIRKFAFLVGGFGENQWHMAQAARDMGAEAIILGEMSEFIVIACLEMGLPVIESLHSVSEIPALKRQATMLSEKLPDLSVHYVPSGALSFASRPMGDLPQIQAGDAPVG
jgi:putative NIF3 family GTP cyclohydrolase 1 type 2